MSNWNKRYASEKTALLEHLFNMGLHGIQQAGDWAFQQGHQLIKDMLHPVTEKFQGSGKELQSLKSVMDNSYKNLTNPNLPSSAKPSAQQMINFTNNYQNYLSENTHPHVNLTGVAADTAALGLAGLGVKKVRDNARRDDVVNYRQQRWNQASPEDRSAIVQQKGRRADPFHPNHDHRDDYGVNWY